MHIRSDFVTNSSSSSFIIARQEELNEKQKSEILRYVVEKFLSGEKISTIDDLNQYAENNGWIYDNILDADYKQQYNKMKSAIERGLTVYVNWVSFEECDYTIAQLYEEITEIANTNQDIDSFIVIDDDLSY